mmetsp:Transcript_25558/g.61046  ORF Transcript_25558/g.61046 Transcript_25558/m.61046 type:complete len:260 (-) Transcript_25558:764-1543(-)
MLRVPLRVRLGKDRPSLGRIRAHRFGLGNHRPTGRVAGDRGARDHHQRRGAGAACRGRLHACWPARVLRADRDGVPRTRGAACASLHAERQGWRRAQGVQAREWRVEDAPIHAVHRSRHRRAHVQNAVLLGIRGLRSRGHRRIQHHHDRPACYRHHAQARRRARRPPAPSRHPRNNALHRTLRDPSPDRDHRGSAGGGDRAGVLRPRGVPRAAAGAPRGGAPQAPQGGEPRVAAASRGPAAVDALAALGALEPPHRAEV